MIDAIHLMLGILAGWSIISHIGQLLSTPSELNHIKAALTLIAAVLAVGFMGVLLK